MRETLPAEIGMELPHEYPRKQHEWRADQTSFAAHTIMPPAENAMDVVFGVFAFVGHAIEATLAYIESHHWIFGFLALGYIYYLHDRSLHARFDALDKRLDEVRRRLSIEY